MVVLKRGVTLLAAAAVACLAISGCAKGDTEPLQPLGQCGFEAQITKDDESFEAMFERSADGLWTAVFSSPEALDGMTVLSLGEVCEVRYQGLSLEIASEDLPSLSVARAIEQCIDHAANSSAADITMDGDLKLIKGETVCGGYELRAEKSGEPVSLYIGSELCATISWFERQE